MQRLDYLVPVLFFAALSAGLGFSLTMTRASFPPC